MKKQAFLFAAAAMALAPVFAQTKLVEKVTTNGPGKLVIPYEKYLLPNGLQLVVHEDHSDPVVYVDVTYHVGSAREQEGRSGFAHFFEHMMFQGSDHVKDDEHFKIVQEAGGTLNGSTNTDRTNYFETMPSNQLEVALWLEADRMGFLLDSVTQQKFEIQRETVKNERGQRYDNAPYGLVGERTGEALYPEGHPYSWTTIGYIEDLNRVNVTDLKKFFLRWYGPNNATLTVAGDVKTADVVKLVEKYYGSIPRCPEVKPMPKMPVKLASDRVISQEDNVRFAQLSMSWPGVAMNDPDEAALDAMCDILSSGKGSIFYKNFIKPGWAQNASAFSGTQELCGAIRVNVRAFPGHSLAQMDSLVSASFAEFEKTGVTNDDIARYRLKIENALLDQMATVQSKGAMLASYSTFNGNPNMIAKDLDRYAKVTKADVMRVYNKYIKGQHCVVMSVYPKGKPNMKARPDNFTPPPHKADAAESAEYKGLTYVKAKDNFDRSIHPTPGPAPVVNIPGLWQHSYANGLRLIGTENKELPRVNLQLTVTCGHRQEDPAKAGVSQLMVRMMDQSTTKHSAEAIEAELEKLGSEVSISPGSEEVTISVTSLTRNLDATLKLVEEKLFMPKWDATEFELMKKQQMEAIANQGTQPAAMADFIFSRMLFGSESIVGVPASGTAETVQKLTIDDVKNFYNTEFSPNIARFVFVGELSKAQLLPKLTFLENWKSTNVQLKPEAAIPPAGGTKIFLYNKEKAAQSEIRVGRAGMKYDATGEFYKVNLMNFALGGNFNSRINMSLREAHGWTYGSRSAFTGSDYTGTYFVNAPVRSNVSDSSVAEIMAQVKRYANEGVTPQELEYTKKALIYSEALRYEAPNQKTNYLDRILRYNLPPDYSKEQKAVIESITKPEIDALAKKWLDPDHMVISIAGDKESIEPKLAKLGYPIENVDQSGNIIPKPVVKEEPKQPEPPKEQPKEEPKKGKKKNKKPKGAKYGEITK